MTNEFFKQIIADINDYKEQYPNNNDIQRPEWAFNYWILDKLYSVDESLIFDQIIDVHDKGIDCYYFDDEDNSLYLMQNKFYNPELGSGVSGDYLQDLAILPLGLLNQGKYTHSQELQDIYNKLKRRKEYKVTFIFYITKQLDEETKKKMFQKFNLDEKHGNIKFEIKDLVDIYRSYYEDYSDGQTKNLDFDLKVKNSKLILDMNTEEIDIPLNAKYAMVSVKQFYEMVEIAKDNSYNLFDENIRDYLGSGGKINSKIKDTLKDGKDKRFFVYYNNGITVVCSGISKLDENGDSFTISNPKIVNGCQTVSTIHEVLKEYKYLHDDDPQLNFYNDVFVMTKFLDSSSLSEDKEEITKNIVERNNSQNSIDISIFNIKKKELSRIQEEFRKKGFLLLIKQSDRNTFTNQYKKSKFEELKGAASEKLKLFGLSYDKVSQFMIPLDKFLQTVYCFKENAYAAYTKKSKMVKDAKTHNEIVDYITDPNNGVLEDFLNIYLLYARAEQDRKSQKYGDDRTPIPLYLLDFFSRIECDRVPSALTEKLANNETVDKKVHSYAMFTRSYTQMYYNVKKVDYNKMIKQKIDDDILQNVKSVLVGTFIN